MAYQAQRIPDIPTDRDLQSVLRDYEEICKTVIRTVADRYDPEYPFVNTKLDLITGTNFLDDDPIRGKQAIYGWIQGRALEALAGHARWLTDQGETDLADRLDAIIRSVLDQIRRMRDRNDGHL